MKPPQQADAVSFDRDLTVNVGLAPGPVPLGWVTHLVERGPSVYAHGNQILTDESGAHGLEWVMEQVEYPFGTHPEVALSRLERLEMIQRLHPDASRLYAVDDAFKLGVDEGDIPAGWTLFTPEEFVETFERCFETGR